MVEITPEESFLIQSYALVESLGNLQKLEQSNAPWLTDAPNKVFGQVAETVSKQASVFGGQGFLVSTFYMLLVLPFEWKKNGIGEFDELDHSKAERVANDLAQVVKDTYTGNVNALRHFRNALAHGRVRWNDGNLVIEDEWKEQTYCAEFSMEALGEIAHELNVATLQFFISKDVARTNDTSS